jgi:DNA-binding transcriptional regulator LsrR (DeoR family)
MSGLPRELYRQRADRDRKALDLFHKGLTHVQIAERLGVRRTTVPTMIERARAREQRKP